jgi:hypothetical protein
MACMVVNMSHRKEIIMNAIGGLVMGLFVFYILFGWVF